MVKWWQYGLQQGGSGGSRSRFLAQNRTFLHFFSSKYEQFSFIFYVKIMLI